MSDRFQQLAALVLGALILLFTAWVYWPGQAGPALLDDATSVLVIGDLKKHPELAWDYIWGDKSGPLGRPVSMASFVLEKLLLDGELTTSKQVNILLHLCNGALVIWLFWPLFRFLGIPGYRMLALVLGKDHEPGDPDCGGSTAQNRDMMFIDHYRTGYQDGDGPGNAYILERSNQDTAVPTRWTPG